MKFRQPVNLMKASGQCLINRPGLFKTTCPRLFIVKKTPIITSRVIILGQGYFFCSYLTIAGRSRNTQTHRVCPILPLISMFRNHQVDPNHDNESNSSSIGSSTGEERKDYSLDSYHILYAIWTYSSVNEYLGSVIAIPYLKANEHYLYQVVYLLPDVAKGACFTGGAYILP